MSSELQRIAERDEGHKALTFPPQSSWFYVHLAIKQVGLDGF